jgi:hypothetical protein
MPSHISNPWTHAVSYLELNFGSQNLASGSGFFWSVGNRTFLVTNWHNLSGRDPSSGLPMSPTGGLPNCVSFTVYKKTSEVDSDGYFSLEVVKATVPLCDSDLTNPRWYQHPTLGSSVDVAAIDVTEVLSFQGAHINCVNSLESDADIESFASQDVFIVGYPLGLVAGIPTPVWKRGTIATEPTFDPDGLPKLYVDAATRKGMSGSVVIARHIVLGNYRKKNGEEVQVLYARKDLVLGVYCGRLHPHNIEAQLGIVWKRRTIEETILGKASP